MTTASRCLTAFGVALLSILLTQCGGTGPAKFCAGPCQSTTGQKEFLYATSTSNGGQILPFSIDSNSGVLGASTPVPGPKTASGIASAQNQFLYASDMSEAAIHAFSIDQTTGALSVIPGSPFSGFGQGSSMPLSLVAGPAVYTTAENGITGFTIGSTGALSTVVGSPYAGGFSGQAVLAQTNTMSPNTFLYATNPADPNGAISVFQLVSPQSGLLTPVPGNFFTGASTGPHAIVFAGALSTPFVFVELQNSKQIAAFSVDPSTGALTTVPGSPFTTGFVATSLALSGEQKFLYALDSAEGKISAYGISSKGILSPIANSPFTVGANPTSIAITVENFLYVTLPDSNTIQGFMINANTGAITSMPVPTFAALGPGLLSVVQVP